MNHKVLNFLKILAILILILGVHVIASFPDKYLHIITCDVGQGDASLIVYKSTQILIDGGPPNRRVLKCLSKYLPFWDRDIEVVVMTHPQLDHYGGLIDIFQSYQVGSFILSDLVVSAQEYGVLENLVGVSGARIINTENVSGMRLGMMYLDIVYPTRDFYFSNTHESTEGEATYFEKNRKTDRDPNDFSVVAILSLEKFDAIFTGDIGPAVIDGIINEGKLRDVEYVKTPHHGSKNGLTKSLLEAVSPELATISVGKGNRFGHPHKETLDLLREFDVKYYRTDEMGDVEIVSDGERYWVVE